MFPLVSRLERNLKAQCAKLVELVALAMLLHRKKLVSFGLGQFDH
jgi:hypothetical protein